jgi:hypothetical protein
MFQKAKERKRRRKKERKEGRGEEERGEARQEKLISGKYYIRAWEIGLFG